MRWLCARFPSSPGIDTTVDGFEATDSNGLASNVHFRLVAVLEPVSSGTYTFLLSAGGPASLFLTSDLNLPSSATVIAHTTAATAQRSWYEQTSQKSVPVHLQVGKSYYLEVQGRGTHATVGALLSRAIFNAKDTVAVQDEVQVRLCVAGTQYAGA